MQTVEIIVEGDDPPGDPVVTVVALSSTVVAEQPSVLSNLAYANQVSSSDLGAKSQVANQDAMNRLGLTILADAVARVQPGPVESRSAVTVLTSNALAQQIADLKSAVDAFATAP